MSDPICKNCGTNSDHQTRCCAQISQLSESLRLAREEVEDLEARMGEMGESFQENANMVREMKAKDAEVASLRAEVETLRAMLVTDQTDVTKDEEIRRLRGEVAKWERRSQYNLEMRFENYKKLDEAKTALTQEREAGKALLAANKWFAARLCEVSAFPCEEGSASAACYPCTARFALAKYAALSKPTPNQEEGKR